jgi:outer membrane protein assembly factor BamB
MALQDGVLYALVGKEEPHDPTLKGDRKARGWPWGGPLGKGYNSKSYPWGFGQTLIAVDAATKRVLWTHREAELLDARAMCMADGRIYFYSHGKHLGCLDASTGKVRWRNSAPEMLAAIGEHKFAQNPREGFSTSSYVKANDKALYFAGPTRKDLAAVSTADGSLLWRQPDAGNSQLVLRDDGLYAMSPGQSARYDFLSGKVLTQLGPRINCTRATGSIDSIFVRGGRDGTMRYDLVHNTQQHLCPMRPSCQDGVIASFGHLYWGPWMCDCNLSLVGVIALEPAGTFDFAGAVKEAERLEAAPGEPAAFEVGPADWPTLRADNSRRATSQAAVPERIKSLWTYQPKSGAGATAPTAAGGLVFTAGRDGTVRALDAASGAARWTVHTGGAIYYPPTLWQNRAYVGSGDGWIYCLEAATGKQLWRFRASPADRRIPLYGSLSSTWPVASGVLVEDGVAYAAAGIANHDGTHVYALDAVSGKLRWHNGSSGRLHPETASGVSVNGHLLLHGKQLHLAGGNMTAVGSYDVANGKCVTDPQAPVSHTQFRAGSDLFVVGNQVVAAGSPLHSSLGDYRMVSQAMLQTPAGDLVMSYGPHDSRVALLPAGSGAQANAAARWQQKPLNRIYGLAVARNAVVIAGVQDATREGESPSAHVVTLNLKDGSTMWSHSLPTTPVPWGVLVNRAGRVVVSLQDGRTVCIGAADG